MKLRLTSVVSKPAFAGAALALAALVAGIGIGSANPEAMVARSFTAALGTDATQVSLPVADSNSGPLVAGTEEFWLDQKRKHDGSKLQAASWPSSEALGLAIGDRISISSNGATRVLEVVSISELPADKTQIEVGPAAVHAVTVTCRDTSTADGQLVKFVTPVAQPALTAVKHPQTL